MTSVTNSGYFKWLCNIVGNYEEYLFLLQKLFNKEFYWTIDMDENRAGDGLALRDRYIREENLLGWDVEIVNGERIDISGLGPCSVLEMLIALAIRCEKDIMNDPKEGDRTGFWFWKMIENLGFLDYKNKCIDEKIDRKIDEKLLYFLDRKFEKSGKNGLFPLKKWDKDQRKVEIWYQLMAWLDENYPQND